MPPEVIGESLPNLIKHPRLMLRVPPADQAPDDVRKIMGANLLRVFQQVIG